MSARVCKIQRMWSYAIQKRKEFSCRLHYINLKNRHNKQRDIRKQPLCGGGKRRKQKASTNDLISKTLQEHPPLNILKQAFGQYKCRFAGRRNDGHYKSEAAAS